jgi:hypothetical protein
VLTGAESVIVTFNSLGDFQRSRISHEIRWLAGGLIRI